jgi:hypothetical protein
MKRGTTMREKFARWMMGRYGNDHPNATLVWTSMILLVLNIFVRNSILTLIAYVLWGFSLYRMFSRKIYARSNENVWFMAKTKKVRHHLSAIRKGMQDKAHRYFVCPGCGQLVRVPKGRGKIEITCPSCRRHFDRKS